MNDHYYQRFQEKTNDQLRIIFNDPASYTKDAFLAAFQVLQERDVEIDENITSFIEGIKRKEATEKSERVERQRPSAINRIIALGIDFILLSGISFVLGFVLISTPLVRGPWALLLSFVIFLSYFVLATVIGGATLGKKLLRLRIEDKEFQPIGWGLAIGRYSLLFAPFFVFEGLGYLSPNTFGILYGLKWCYYIAWIFFFVSDPSLRRGFHDLICNTVVRGEGQPRENAPYPMKNIWLFGGISLAVVALFVALNLSLYSSVSSISANFEEQRERLQTKLEENQSVFEKIVEATEANENVAQITGLRLDKSGSGYVFEITIRPNSFSVSPSVADEVFESIKQYTSEIPQVTTINVIQEASFKLTLASFHNNQSKNFELQ